MATSTASASGPGIDKAHRQVIFASSLGTVFEWYDFYLYGSLAAIISKQFFSGGQRDHRLHLRTCSLSRPASAVRPFGALVFGRLGDLVGRKHTFLITIVIMGLSTALVGLLPSYATRRRAGADRPGGAAPIAGPGTRRGVRRCRDLRRRARAAGQARPVHQLDPDHGDAGPIPDACGDPRSAAWSGKTDFEAWGWRIPFLLSFVLLAISVYIRLQLAESPVFSR